MKYIKDFFYNLSDLFIILLILGVAGVLIYWRLNVIMDYPETLAAEIRDGGNQGLVPDDIINNDDADEGSDANTDGTDSEDPNKPDDADDNQGGTTDDGKTDNGDDDNTDADNNDDDNTDAENPDDGEGNDADTPDDGGDAENPDDGDNSSAHEPGSGPRDNTIWKDGKLRVDMTVDLTGTNTEDAIAALVQAGLFASPEDFAAICDQINKDPDNIAAYKYNFSAGFSQKDIADYVTND